MELDTITSRIYEIRGEKVMFDFDLAELYGIETKVLNQAVKRNHERFPYDFMFKINQSEWEIMRSQFVTASSKKRNITASPYVFTEHGVTMLSCILRSNAAIKMNIAIVRAFVTIRRAAIEFKPLQSELVFLKEKIDSHDMQLDEIYTVIENILKQKSNEKSWDERERIGFDKNR